MCLAVYPLYAYFATQVDDAFCEDNKRADGCNIMPHAT